MQPAASDCQLRGFKKSRRCFAQEQLILQTSYESVLSWNQQWWMPSWHWWCSAELATQTVRELHLEVLLLNDRDSTAEDFGDSVSS
jgi:hypothetical protein